MAGRTYTPEQLARANELPAPVDSFAGHWTAGQRSLIEVTDGCWHWTGRIDRDGYPRSSNGKLAHRLAYAYWVAPIPLGFHVDHSCHNNDQTCADGATCMHRRCVRPDHLEAIPAAENLRNQYTARRSHCDEGHEYTRENTIYKRGNGRRCRQCWNDAQRNISWNSKLNKWRAYTRAGGRRRSLGNFATRQDAVRACERAAQSSPELQIGGQP